MISSAQSALLPLSGAGTGCPLLVNVGILGSHLADVLLLLGRFGQVVDMAEEFPECLLGVWVGLGVLARPLGRRCARRGRQVQVILTQMTYMERDPLGSGLRQWSTCVSQYSAGGITTLDCVIFNATSCLLACSLM